MNYYVLQNKDNAKYIYTENPLTVTSNFDRALLFKEETIKTKLKQYKDYKSLRYYSLGSIVTKY